MAACLGRVQRFRRPFVHDLAALHRTRLQPLDHVGIFAGRHDAGVLAGMREAPERGEIAAMFERHYRATLEFYGGLPGLRHARKHVGWTLDRFAGSISPARRSALLTSDDPERRGCMNADPSKRKTKKGNVNELAIGVLNAIQNAVIMVDEDGYIAFANWEAEAFFGASEAYLSRHTIYAYIPFGSPLLTLIDQVRERRAPVNEYRVDLSSPRLGADKLVDIYVAPVLTDPGSV
eukprot:gene4464-6109_t